MKAREKSLVSIMLVTLTSAALIVGCSAGHKSSKGPVDAAFINAANTACEPFLDQGADKPFPYPSFVATDPLVTQLVAAGKYYDGLPINHQEYTLVKDLGQPRQGTTTWNAFVALIEQEQVLVGNQIKSAEASDKAGFVASVNEISALATKIDAQAAAVGFAKDSSCTELFG